jgi:AraC-like DNA-binding protein
LTPPTAEHPSAVPGPHDPHRAQRTAIAERVADVVPGRVRGIVYFALAQGHLRRSVSELAAALGMPRKSLDRRLSDTTTVSARELLGWGRIIALSVRLTGSLDNTAVVSDELQFASPSALRNMVHRYARLTPTDLRRPGTTNELVERLISVLKSERRTRAASGTSRS